MAGIFAQCPPGLEGLSAKELAPFLEAPIQTTRGGFTTKGDLKTVVNMNLHSSLCTRVLVRIASFPAFHLSELRSKIARIDWSPWLEAGKRVRVQVRSSRSKIYHTKAAAERILDAMNTNVLAKACPRDQDPDLSIHARITRNQCTISIDSSGQPLWQRGKKKEISAAPIRPNLAAAALQIAKFRPGETLMDPMCGSGTIIIEALRMTMGLAPGLDRHFAFENWPVFEPGILEREIKTTTRQTHEDESISIFASDLSPGAVGMTRRNLKRIDKDKLVALERRDIADLDPPSPKGLWICNPPYGRRLSATSIRDLYRTIGRVYSNRFKTWRLVLLCPEPQLIEATGLDMRQVGPPLEHGGLKLRVFRTGPGH